ncbi:CBS domain-containing protein, partial [candidate division GN15 bacterium]|nr:CBS domain-containing protein [candidate division GN15 bacterium]
FYAGLGTLAGVVSWVFIKSVFSLSKVWEDRVRIPPYLKATFGGLAIGIIALFFPQIMGVGYDSINLTLNHESMTYMGLGAEFIDTLLGSQTFWIVTLALVLVKIFATSMTLGSGGSGGIFAPSLFVGAMLGAAFGHFIHLLFPDITATTGTYALIAMGGMVAGTTRAPITAIVTIFEITKETSIILPLMITCILATIVSSKFSRESIYTLKLLLRNINIRGHAEVNVMKSLHVKDLYTTDYVSLPETRDFKVIVTSLVSSGLPYISVHDIRNGGFMGIISIHTVKDVMFEQETLRYLCIAGDIADRKIERADEDDNCSVVLKKMRRCGYDCLPVVEHGNEQRQIGMIWLKDIVSAYDREVERIELTSGLAERIAMSNLESDIRFLEGYVITELHAPRQFAGKTIRELQVRGRFGVDILSIKSVGHGSTRVEAIPQADYVIAADDLLVVAGKAENINILKNLE